MRTRINGANTVTPISTATNRPGKPINAGKDLDGIAIIPDGRTAYVVSTSSATVTPIRTATNTALKLIKVGTGPPGQPGPGPIAITPDGKVAYVVNLIAGTVTPTSTATNTPRPASRVSSNRVLTVSSTIWLQCAPPISPNRPAASSSRDRSCRPVPDRLRLGQHTKLFDRQQLHRRLRRQALGQGLTKWASAVTPTGPTEGQARQLTGAP